MTDKAEPNKEEVIELHSLAKRHPACGNMMVRCYGPSLVHRLAIEPFELPSGVKGREVLIDHDSPHAQAREAEDIRAITWRDEDVSEDERIRIRIVKNQHDLTEEAALCMMFLLIHVLERGQIQEVLAIGESGDYVVLMPDRSQLLVEVSGITRDETGDEVRSRARKKREQVLTGSASGFVSVTTFLYKSRSEVHSLLHFVTKAKQQRNQGDRKKRKKK
jgi:hypothetical protein